ncbi:hypothetical protein D3P08_01700 [Paenibacillus nanensis]|uniref:Uncharacterized protein n=1 Tax=Paenibacillus nanensis TaxID=393251 RepID=A0A3A1VHA4_9BACL|nr:hypothetical protein D3P08_01700 [Paenibacillus nanensis]
MTRRYAASMPCDVFFSFETGAKSLRAVPVNIPHIPEYGNEAPASGIRLESYFVNGKLTN